MCRRKPWRRLRAFYDRVRAASGAAESNSVCLLEFLAPQVAVSFHSHISRFSNLPNPAILTGYPQDVGDITGFSRFSLTVPQMLLHTPKSRPSGKVIHIRLWIRILVAGRGLRIGKRPFLAVTRQQHQPARTTQITEG